MAFIPGTKVCKNIEIFLTNSTNEGITNLVGFISFEEAPAAGIEP